MGTSWYERGISYWARRAGIMLLLIATLAIYIAIISGPLNAAGRTGSPGFLAALTGEFMFSLATGVLMIRHFWRLGISGRSGPGRSGRAGAGLGMLAHSAGGAAGAFMIVVGALISGGFLLAVIAIGLVPVPPAEQYARRQLAETLRLRQHARHGHGLAGPQRPEHRGGRH